MTTSEMVAVANLCNNNNNNNCSSRDGMKVNPEDASKQSEAASSASSTSSSQMSPVGPPGSSAFTVVSPKSKDNEGKYLLQAFL